jgi:putative endonuclease
MKGEMKKAQTRKGVPCWHLYVVRAEDGSLYAGISTDLQRRLREHEAQGRKAAKYLIAHKPQNLAFSHPVGNRSLALKVEHSFKRLPKSKKEKIIDSQKMIFDKMSGKIIECELPLPYGRASWFNERPDCADSPQA